MTKLFQGREESEIWLKSSKTGNKWEKVKKIYLKNLCCFSKLDLLCLFNRKCKNKADQFAAFINLFTITVQWWMLWLNCVIEDTHRINMGASIFTYETSLIPQLLITFLPENVGRANSSAAIITSASPSVWPEIE